MWVFTSTGFVSAVKINQDLVVRSRDRQSLESLRTFTSKTIQRTPLSDYPYRLITTSEQFSTWLKLVAEQVDYPNFKSEVAVTRSKAFARTLEEVWSIMHEVEDKEARER